MIKNICQIIQTIERNRYAYIGIRHICEDEDYSIGDYCRDSYDWDYEYDRSSYDSDEPISLGGTCALSTGIDSGLDAPEEIIKKFESAIEKSKCYYGPMVIVAGNSATYGNDEDEIIIRDAIVLAVETEDLIAAA